MKRSGSLDGNTCIPVWMCVQFIVIHCHGGWGLFYKIFPYSLAAIQPINLLPNSKCALSEMYLDLDSQVL